MNISYTILDTSLKSVRQIHATPIATNWFLYCFHILVDIFLTFFSFPHFYSKFLFFYVGSLCYLFCIIFERMWMFLNFDCNFFLSCSDLYIYFLVHLACNCSHKSSTSIRKGRWTNSKFLKIISFKLLLCNINSAILKLILMQSNLYI